MTTKKSRLKLWIHRSIVLSLIGCVLFAVRNPTEVWSMFGLSGWSATFSDTLLLVICGISIWVTITASVFMLLALALIVRELWSSNTSDYLPPPL